jgi:DNA-binding LacI/PurR family transcriptional regulator
MAKGKPKSPDEDSHVNLKKLSELLRLSQTTISLVLNDSPTAKSIPLHTRERVFAAAKKFHYRPNYFARSLRKKRSMAVGVMAPNLSEGYLTLVLNGVEEYLIKSHYFYFTASHFWKPELIEEYPRMLMERAVDGFLLLNTGSDINIPLPTVAISGHINRAGTCNIILDHEKAAELGLGHLYELGHRKIAFMSGPDFIPDSAYRWRSTMQVAHRLGLKVLPEVCMKFEADIWSPGLGYDVVKELLSRTRDFTAISCFNDITAVGAIRAIQDEGLSVPGDISVIGFDDIVSAAFLKPSLTTIHQPLHDMGVEGAQVLLQKIADPAFEMPAEIVMQPTLTIRESTGPASLAVGRKTRRKFDVEQPA